MTAHAEWLGQAHRDLDVAKHLHAAGYYEWAAYAGQQAAEKAVKALRVALGADPATIRVHEMAKLLGDIPVLAANPDPHLARAEDLDVHNQQARYPHLRGKSIQPPMAAYLKPHADDALAIASAVLVYVDTLIPNVVAMWAQAAPASPPIP